MQHSLNKHKKKRFNPYADDESMPEFQVAPMVDVLLVLLLFFMATATTEIVEQVPELDLPVADASKDPTDHGGQITVNVKRSSKQVEMSDRAFDKADDLIPLLKKAKAADTEVRGGDGHDYRVFIRADKETKYSLIKEIMQACAKAGISNVTFAATKGGEKEGTPAPANGAVK